MKKNSKKKRKKNSTELLEKKYIIIVIIILLILLTFPSIKGLVQNYLFGKGTKFQSVEIKNNKSVNYSEKLFKEVVNKTDSNIVLSDLSINPSLAYFYSLASPPAALEFNNYFNLDSNSLKNNFNNIDKRYKDAYNIVSYSNSLWINKDSKDTHFTERAIEEANNYNIDINNISFSKDINKLNNYIKKKSHNKIDNVDTELKGVDSMLLGTLYFNESWKKSYKSKDIKEKKFKGTKGNTRVPFLVSEDEKYLHTDNAIGFMKKYKTNGLYFVGILPNEGISFNQVSISNLLESSGSIECDAEFPEFEFEYSIDMVQVLKNLGINKIFEGGSLDNLYKDAYVKKINQKNYIKVNRKGTEAVSVTETITTTWGTVAGGPPKVVLDRPFMFLIYDESINQVLFIGRVNNI